MSPNALHSRRFTARSLNCWRNANSLYVREMAIMLGFSLGRLKDKLYGRSPISMQMDRAIENIELLVALGVRPAGWPDRLARRIVATRLMYIDPQSARTPDSSPTEFS
jgi:hypothetical protein